MRVVESSNELIIQETPGCLWLFASLFCFVGGVFVYGTLGGFDNLHTVPFWVIPVTFAMGSIALAVGVWLIYHAPVTRIVLNRTDETVRLTRYGLFGKRQSFFSFDDIKQFFLIEEKDDEDNLIWSLGINLTSGETIKISALPSHSEEFKRKFVFETNQFMYKQMPSHQAVLELEDESDTKMS